MEHPNPVEVESERLTPPSYHAPSKLHLAEDRIIFEVIRAHRLHRGPVLDLGCGAGDYLAHVRKSPSDYVGLASTDYALSEARANYPRHIFTVQDLTEIGTPDNWDWGTFGSVVSLYGAFNRVREPVAALEHVRSVMRRGARLGLMVATQRHWKGKSSSYTTRYLTDTLAMAGFEIERVYGLNWLVDSLPGWLPQSWYEALLRWEPALWGREPNDAGYLFAIARNPL